MRTTSKLLIATTAVLSMLGATAAAAAPAGPPADTGKPFQVQLEPEQEIAPFTGVEDASGDVSLRLNPGQGQVCVDGVIDGFEPALVHIHKGPAGSNGPVVVNFTEIDDNVFAGCVDVDRQLVRDIIRNPADYYVNTHLGALGTPEFFEGVRGQLSR